MQALGFYYFHHVLLQVHCLMGILNQFPVAPKSSNNPRSFERPTCRESEKD